MRGIALLSLNRTIKNLIFGLGGTLLFLGLVFSGWGNWTSFFFNPARTGAIILALTGAIAYGFSGSSGLAIGRAEDRSSRWIFIPIIIIGIAFGWLPPHLDRLNLCTIDGNTIRYVGLFITAIGGFVCITTVFELGHRFSMFVALQPVHRLKTDGFYALIRHPSYLGMLTAMAGWALVFRSMIGLLFVAAMCVPIFALIRAEEDFLVREFGKQYRVYQQHTRWHYCHSFTELQQPYCATEGRARQETRKFQRDPLHFVSARQCSPTFTIYSGSLAILP